MRTYVASWQITVVHNDPTVPAWGGAAQVEITIEAEDLTDFRAKLAVALTEAGAAASVGEVYF